MVGFFMRGRMGGRSSQVLLPSGEYGQGAKVEDKTMFGLNATYLAIIAFVVVVAGVVALLNSLWKPKD